MAWMKESTGKTLGDVVAEYQRQQAETTRQGFQSKIAQHNQYTRDFLANDPNMGLADVRKFRALKRDMPSEDRRHVYDKSDLDLG